MSELFNAQGQLNAGSLQEALTTLTKDASVLQEGLPSNVSLAGQPGLNDAKRDELISRAIMTHEGKLALAQAMANPIRRNLDYQGIARTAGRRRRRSR